MIIIFNYFKILFNTHPHASVFAQYTINSPETPKLVNKSFIKNPTNTSFQLNQKPINGK